MVGFDSGLNSCLGDVGVTPVVIVGLPSVAKSLVWSRSIWRPIQRVTVRISSSRRAKQKHSSLSCAEGSLCGSGHFVSDIFSRKTRSRVMSRIRSSGNHSTEKRLMTLFRESGIVGWRRRCRLFGRPDFVFYAERVVVFVDGCFWHGCPRCRNKPRTNTGYWTNKNRRNMARDRLVSRTLTKTNWLVVRIWEHSLVQPNAVVSRIKKCLKKRARRDNGRAEACGKANVTIPRLALASAIQIKVTAMTAFLHR